MVHEGDIPGGQTLDMTNADESVLNDVADAETSTEDAVSADGAPRKPRSALVRVIAVWVLIVLASVLTLGSAAEIWVKRQLLDTTAWTKMSDKILEQPEVQQALATYIVNQIYSSVDVKQALADQLPDSFKGLSGPVAGAIRGPATSGVETLLGTAQVQQLWHTINSKAHDAIVRILEDDTRVGSTANGTVSLDLGELIRVVGTDLGIPKAAMDKIPADAGQITLVHSDQLAMAQNAVATLEWMGPVLAILIIAMYALAVWLARGRRRATLRNVGWALVLVGIALLATRRVSGNFVSSLAADPANGPTVALVFSIASQMLADLAWSIVTWGLVIVAGMILLGPSQVAAAVRKLIAPVVNLDATVLWVGAAAAYVVLLLWSPSPALRQWWSAIAMAVMLAAGLEVLRRRALREFPDAGLDVDVDGIKAKAAGAWGSVTDRISRIGAGHDGDSSSDDQVAKLERLTALHDSGALDADEYRAAKQDVLG